MVVNCHGHNLFGLILSNNKLVQLFLDLVGSRNVLDVKSRLHGRFTLFLDLLSIGDSAAKIEVAVLKVSHIQKSNVGNSSGVLIKFVHQIRIV